MKTFSILFTLVTGLLLLSSCRPGNRTNGNANAIATSNGACPVGSWYTNGMCYNGTGSTNSAFNYSNGYYADNYSGTSSFTITNSTKMTEFFKLGMGICDRAAKNGGTANCTTYLSGYIDLIIQFPPQMNGNALITAIAQPKSTPYVNYSYEIPSGMGLLGIALGYVTGYTIPDPSYYQGAYRNPLQIQAVVSAINNNTGFAAQGYGDAWTGLNQTVVAVEVASGSTNSSSFNYVFKIGGVEAAKGKMTRCQYQNCGL